MKVLVTGGTGFVGSALVRRLLADGHELHLLVRPTHDPWRIADVLADVRKHEVDLLDRDRLADTVARIHPEWVFHLGTHGAYSWQTDATEIVRVNVSGTMALVQACLATGFETFVYAGSSSEYGYVDHPPAETEPLRPNSHYALTKAFGTQLCGYEARHRHVALVTLRLYSVYGPYEDSRRLMPTLIAHGLTGRLPSLVDPDVARDYVFIDDAVEAFVLAASTGGQAYDAIYNVGSGVQTSMRDVVDVARRVLGIVERPQWGSMANRAWDTTVWVADARAVRRRLGWVPRFAFEQGFEEMVARVKRSPQLLARYGVR